MALHTKRSRSGLLIHLGCDDPAKLKRKMVEKIVRETRAAGKRVDRQAINLEVLDLVRRKRQ